MAEAKGRTAWGHTSAILALVANVNRDPKKGKPFTPADFNPFELRKRKGPLPKADIKLLKRLWVDNQKETKK